MVSWRLISSTAAPTPGQMAYDGELFKRFQPGQAPILRFFFFDRPTLTLGRLEARRLNLSQLAYPYEIRPTGGRAVLHGADDLCYSIVASTSDPLVGGELLESYRKISCLLANALRGLNRDVRLAEERHPGSQTGHCFSSLSFAELIHHGKKVAGGAQAREGNAFLQQGVILLSVSSEWKNLFMGSAESPMTGLNDDPSVPALNRNDLEKSLVGIFEEAGITFEKPMAAV
jgi:lipoyl(octanoyl) transferase